MVVADHGGHAVGVPDEQGADKHQHIHDDGDGGHAVLPYVFQHGQVEQQGGDAGDQGGGQLGQAVGGGVEQHAPPEHGPLEVEQIVPLPKDQEARRGGEGVPQPRGNGGPPDAQARQGDERVVQDDVGHAPRHGANEGELGPVRRDEVEGEVIH